MNKNQLTSFLNEKFDALYAWLKAQPDQAFEETYKEGKWTTAQHVDHLIKSTNALSNAMSYPKIALRYKFGTCNRPERSLPEIIDKYREKLKTVDTKEFNSTGAFAPRMLKSSDKERTIQELIEAENKLLRKSGKWSEAALSKYVLPHPAMGRMTIRELLIFTAFHTEHHLNNLKENY